MQHVALGLLTVQTTHRGRDEALPGVHSEDRTPRGRLNYVPLQGVDELCVVALQRVVQIHCGHLHDGGACGGKRGREWSEGVAGGVGSDGDIYEGAKRWWERVRCK